VTAAGREAGIKALLEEAGQVAVLVTRVGEKVETVTWICALQMAARLRFEQYTQLHPEERDRLIEALESIDHLVSSLNVLVHQTVPGQPVQSRILRPTKPEDLS
jgi:hypothetical protein